MINDAVTAVRTAVNAINDRSLGDHAAELLDPSFIRHDLAQLFSDSHGPGGASDFVSVIISAMPDFRLTIEDIFGTGDRAVVRLHMSGTHTRAPLLGQPASGRALSGQRGVHLPDRRRPPRRGLAAGGRPGLLPPRRADRLTQHPSQRNDP